MLAEVWHARERNSRRTRGAASTLPDRRHQWDGQANAALFSDGEYKKNSPRPRRGLPLARPAPDRVRHRATFGDLSDAHINAPAATDLSATPGQSGYETVFVPAHDEWSARVVVFRKSDDGIRAADDQARRAAEFERLIEKFEEAIAAAATAYCPAPRPALRGTRSGATSAATSPGSLRRSGRSGVAGRRQTEVSTPRVRRYSAR
jgi:hypothetical protein